MPVQSLKVVLINVAVTFIEGTLAAWALVGHQTTKEALVGAAAAGVSLVWNTVIKPFLKNNGILYKQVN